MKTSSLRLPLRIHVQLSNTELLKVRFIKCASKIEYKIKLCVELQDNQLIQALKDQVRSRTQVLSQHKALLDGRETVEPFFFWLIDWLILTVYQPIASKFMFKGSGIPLSVDTYIFT